MGERDNVWETVSPQLFKLKYKTRGRGGFISCTYVAHVGDWGAAAELSISKIAHRKGEVHVLHFDFYAHEWVPYQTWTIIHRDQVGHECVQYAKDKGLGVIAIDVLDLFVKR